MTVNDFIADHAKYFDFTFSVRSDSGDFRMNGYALNGEIIKNKLKTHAQVRKEFQQMRKKLNEKAHT